MEYTDFVVDSTDVKYIDRILSELFMNNQVLVLGSGTPDGVQYHDGRIIVRVFGDTFFFKLIAQRYFPIVKKLDK